MNAKERLFLIDELIKVFIKATKYHLCNNTTLNCAISDLNDDKNHDLYDAITIDGFAVSSCDLSSKALYKLIDKKLYDFMKKHDPIFGSIYDNCIMLNITNKGKGRIYYNIEYDIYSNIQSTKMEINIPIPKRRMSYTTFRTYIKKNG